MKNLEDMTEEDIEKFIIENRDKFEVAPRPEVVESFKIKLRRIAVSIVPYIIKIGLIVFIVWSLSILAWKIFGIPTLWDLIFK